MKFLPAYCANFSAQCPKPNLMIYKFSGLMSKLSVMKNRLFIFSILIFCAAFSAFAQQRPLLTEDVDITPAGSVEISAGVDFLQNAKFPLSGLKGEIGRASCRERV